MPGFIGKKLCPDLEIVPLNFEKYTAVSKLVKSIFSKYDPNFCPMSLDEAYLDITEHLEHRQGMCEEERTYICRDPEYVDSKTHCLCDLNSIRLKHGWQCFSPSNVAHNSVDNFDRKVGENQAENIASDIKTVIAHSSVDKCDSQRTKMEPAEDNDSSITVSQCTDPGVSRESQCPECGKPFPGYDVRVFGLDAEEAVREMRARIEQRTRLTASAGTCTHITFLIEIYHLSYTAIIPFDFLIQNTKKVISKNIHD